ncbi:MAG: SWIM zinc finger family protein [Planctomycetaceae bacterium]|jgi:hypothetical protein|nr:SWIM zinc finger family protein [Planctomycetaceae bacterium]
MKIGNEIIRLEEISPNHWQAKYRGNYGIYTIKITIDGKKTTKFSCSCPSDYHPCKHIAMIEDAIVERIAQNKKVMGKKTKQKGNVTVEKLLRTASQKELYQFIVRQARYNKDLTNLILLEFAEKVTEKNNNANPYHVILREALSRVDLENIEDDYYHDSEERIEFDALDPVFAKAKEYFHQKNYREVILICKAYIEEFAEWLRQKSKKFNEIEAFIDAEYYEFPFRMLGHVVESSGVDLKELYDYCCVEIRNSKYKVFDNDFHNLFMKLSQKVNPNGFIELQDELLSNISNKSSYEAEIILKRKIDLYKLNEQPKKAWEIIEENIQIESFCKKLAEKKIKEKKFAEAKKLIENYLGKNQNKTHRTSWDWNKLLLEIAQKEKDTPTIREISFTFIKDNFDAEYFKIYKSTFADKEWAAAFEQLFTRYKNKGINAYSDRNSAADILVAENAVERLMEFVEKRLSVELVERYYEHFATNFPQKTLLMFRKVLDKYAKDNAGRNVYEHIALLLKKMQKIDGGKKFVKEMVEQYRVRYKNRKAMREILSEF